MGHHRAGRDRCRPTAGAGCDHQGLRRLLAASQPGDRYCRRHGWVVRWNAHRLHHGALLEDDISTLLIIQAVFAVIVFIAMAVALSRPGRFADDVDVVEGVSVESTKRHPLRTVWTDPIMRLLIGVVAVGFGVFVALTTWLQALLEPAGVSAATSAVILLVMVVAGIIGAALLPPIAARRGNQLAFIFAALAVAMLGCLALAALPGEWTGYVVAAALGLLLLSVLPIVLEMVEERAGAAVSTATSAVWLAGNGGGVIVSGVIGCSSVHLRLHLS